MEEGLVKWIAVVHWVAAAEPALSFFPLYE
jgi:hypothetical protein